MRWEGGFEVGWGRKAKGYGVIKKEAKWLGGRED